MLAEQTIFIDDHATMFCAGSQNQAFRNQAFGKSLSKNHGTQRLEQKAG
jgi:hypothetical protein